MSEAQEDAGIRDADRDKRSRTISKVIAIIVLAPIALWFLALLAQLVGILR